MISMFKTKYGKLSHTRITSTLAIVTVWFTWAKVSLDSGTLQPIPESTVILLAALVTGTITNTQLSEGKKEKENAITSNSNN